MCVCVCVCVCEYINGYVFPVYAHECVFSHKCKHYGSIESLFSTNMIKYLHMHLCMCNMYTFLQVCLR